MVTSLVLQMSSIFVSVSLDVLSTVHLLAGARPPPVFLSFSWRRNEGNRLVHHSSRKTDSPKVPHAAQPSGRKPLLSS